MSGRVQPETRIVQSIIRWINLLPEATAHKVHSGPYGANGEPDIDAVVRGRAVKLEVKTPGTEASVTKRLTPHQRNRLRAYRDAGAVAAVVTTLGEAQLVMSILDDEAPPMTPERHLLLKIIGRRLDPPGLP